MTPFLLILVVFVQFRDIVGLRAGILSPEPFDKEFCDYDAFIRSKPINGKEFLAPAIKADRSDMDWYENRAYCSKHCAEMVTIKSLEEHVLVNEFFKHLQYTNIWLGAQIVNQTLFSEWSNGDDATAYQPKEPTEYNEVTPLACADLWNLNKVTVWGYWCHLTQGVACQRSADWVPCE